MDAHKVSISDCMENPEHPKTKRNANNYALLLAFWIPFVLGHSGCSCVLVYHTGFLCYVVNAYLYMHSMFHTSHKHPRMMQIQNEY